jgi:hypothetical protein
MSKVAGYALLLAGVGCGAYAFMPNALAPSAMVVGGAGAGSPSAIVTSAKIPTVVADIVAPASPKVPVPQLAQRPAASNLASAGPVSGSVTVQPSAPAAIPAIPTLVAKPREAMVAVPLPAPSNKSGPGEDEARVQLAREIQRELKRVGCYSGDVDGDWAGASRTAMKTFIDRINATLPTDQPDHILKTLVQGHPGNACGKTCPAGQGLAGDGRCQTTAVLAQQQATRRPVVRAADAPSRPVVAQGSGAPSGAVATASATARSDAQWRTTVTATLAAPAAGQSVPAAVALAPRPEILEGRMAMGAPVSKEASEPVTQTRNAVTPNVPRVAALPAPRVDDEEIRAAAPKQRVAPARDERRQAQPERRPTPPQNVYVAPRPRYVAAVPQYYYAPKPSYQGNIKTLNQRVFSQVLRDGR